MHQDEQKKANIYVDLDGTLIKTDLLVESIFRFLKASPLNGFRLLRWLMEGRPVLKAKLAAHIVFAPEDLPYNQSLLEYLRECHRDGHRLILATASYQDHANLIAQHLDFFDEVLATGQGVNLKGPKKLEAILAREGGEGFIYAGDSAADRPIWEAAEAGIYVNAPEKDVAAAVKTGKDFKVLKTESSVLQAFIKEMRVHQWAKNALVFVPLLTAHQYHDLAAVFAALVAFVAFSLCASGIYFGNDLLDLDADRHHATKSARPLAAGDLPLTGGALGALLLPLAGLLLGLLCLPWLFVITLLSYIVVTSAYSLYLKRRSTIDVMTLAFLYTLRIIAGAVAIEVALSSWLFGFSVFFFVSLAYLKRYIEIAKLVGASGNAEGRGYSSTDTETTFVLGVANMTGAVLVMALFITSDEVVALYGAPQILWGLCFILLYWGNRIWVGARRGKITEDPVVFALKDPVSRFSGLACVLVIVAAKVVEISP